MVDLKNKNLMVQEYYSFLYMKYRNRPLYEPAQTIITEHSAFTNSSNGIEMRSLKMTAT